MSTEEVTIETLRRWSQVLLWVSVILPVLGALAVRVRYYVERQEKQLSAKITATAIGQAKQDTETARGELAELARKTAPRSLSSEQQKLLLDNLSGGMEAGKKNNFVIGKIIVTAANGNQEAQNYAMQFVKIFKASGCESDLSLPIPGLRPDIIGIHIGVRNLQNIPDGALILSKVLSNAGIEFTISKIEGDFLPEALFSLVVGAKPY